MKKSLALLLLLPVIFFITSCEKEKDNNPTPKTKTELLTTGTWKFSSATSSGIDVSAALQSCQKDNIYQFNTGGTGSIDEGATKCNSGDPQTSALTWAWLSNETKLQLSAPLFSGTSGDVTLVSLTETELIGSMVISGQTVIAKFIH